MRSKFKPGDEVRFTKRATKYVLEGFIGRTRIVKNIFYDNEQQCCYYHLAEKPGYMLPAFRSYMLRPVKPEERHNNGRPKTKRKYLHKKLLLPTPTEQATEQTSETIVGYSPPGKAD